LALRHISNAYAKAPKVAELVVPALITALGDEQFDVRWLASEALLAVGGGAVRPLLRVLMERPGVVWLRESAHHVLYELTRQSDYCELTPVLEALEGMVPAIEVPWAAKQALDAWEGARLGEGE
jgi:HEAT repeat protein